MARREHQTPKQAWDFSNHMLDGSEALFNPLISEFAAPMLHNSYTFRQRLLPKLYDVMDRLDPNWRKGTVLKVQVDLEYWLKIAIEAGIERLTPEFYAEYLSKQRHEDKLEKRRAARKLKRQIAEWEAAGAKRKAERAARKAAREARKQKKAAPEAPAAPAKTHRARKTAKGKKAA